jgi:hypothetical protein
MALALGTGAVAGLAAGRTALLFGLLATGIQLAVPRAAAGLTPTAEYGVGMALRVAGVAVLGIAMVIDRVVFPPGAAAVGYLGTLLPLLWLETRLT